jgi:hypothetical protein
MLITRTKKRSITKEKTMTGDYEYDNLPYALEAEALPAEMFEAAQNAFIQATTSGLALKVEAKAVHVYDRKGYLNADSFIGHQNPAYRSATDDVIIQLTVRIPNPKTIRGEDLSHTTALEDFATEYDQRAEKARLEAELAKAEQDAAKAETAAREAREKLEALRKK